MDSSEDRTNQNYVQDNMQKYYNYREQMTRLKKALKSQFFLEAIFIEYSIMEDRLESVLRHAGVWKKMLEKGKKSGRPNITIEQKIKKVEELARKKGTLENKYFSGDLMNNIRSWKDKRNPLMHALLKLQLHTEDLEQIAVDGEALVKEMCSKSTSFRRAVEKNRE